MIQKDHPEQYAECVQKGVFRILFQKGALGFEFRKKISLKKMTQLLIKELNVKVKAVFGM